MITQLKTQLSNLIAKLIALIEEAKKRGIAIPQGAEKFVALQGAVIAPKVAIPASGAYAKVKNMKRGTTVNANDVRALQEFLKAQGGEIYPEGLVTGFYGPLTEKAAQRFQIKYGIVSSGTPATTGFGAVGPKTRAKIDELLGL